MKSFLIYLLFIVQLSAELVFQPTPKGWQEEVKTVHYPASIDQSEQPMLIYPAKSRTKRPLLVGLHTWSGNYKQAGGEVVYARWCIQNDWHFIHPDFRGPNNTPKAMGSEFVVQDIIDAVAFVKKHYAVDSDRIYLIGASGGAYASLVMAGRAPEIWAGVSAWCPITDIEAWWNFHAFKNKKYKPGNTPDTLKLPSRVDRIRISKPWMNV